MGRERFKVLLLAAGAAVSFACAASEKSGIYKAFLTTNAATRRAWMDDADMRKRMTALTIRSSFTVPRVLTGRDPSLSSCKDFLA